MASTEKNFTGLYENITYEATAAAYRYKYDANNRLIKLTHTLNGTTWSTSYSYNADGRQSIITLSNGKTLEYAYDAATGRPDKITLHLDTDYVVDWTYMPGANGSATALISTYTNGSDDRYNYNYDANGNITQIWRGNVSFRRASEKYSYVYDAANQLIRENLYYGSGNSNNATYTYGYDSWGNIISKSEYDYTTGTLGVIQDIPGYCLYNSDQWGDQLINYNGKSVTYDASGNPTNYLGAALVWEGQQLKSYTPENTGSERVNTYTYNYDENGLRTRKTIGSTVTDYYYNGTLLIGIVKTTTNSSGTTTSMQRFSYDADGKVIGVNYNGTYYYYLRNAQGDIVKLIDKNGNAAVEYTYDTWGKLLSTSGSLAYTLGKNNPFRYRGYIYDEETGFYYLQSRYYDPEVRRFISADVYLSTGQGVLGHNAYAYCLNNPVNRSDRAGTISGINIIDFFRELAEGAGGGSAGGQPHGGGTTVPTGGLGEGNGAGTTVGTGPALAGGSSPLPKDRPEEDSQLVKLQQTNSPDGGGKGIVPAPKLKYPGNDPQIAPEGTQWRGTGAPGTGRGNYYNPKTGESWHPDLNHAGSIGPHWDYFLRGSGANGWRVYPDGRVVPK